MEVYSWENHRSLNRWDFLIAIFEYRRVCWWENLYYMWWYVDDVGMFVYCYSMLVGLQSLLNHPNIIEDPSHFGELLGVNYVSSSAQLLLSGQGIFIWPSYSHCVKIHRTDPRDDIGRRERRAKDLSDLSRGWGFKPPSTSNLQKPPGTWWDVNPLRMYHCITIKPINNWLTCK
jgi:hypothetical protein